MKELERILKNIPCVVRDYPSGKITDGAVAQAHSAILAWIESKLPPEMPFTSIGKTTDGFILGHNNYRQQALKNFGIKDV